MHVKKAQFLYNFCVYSAFIPTSSNYETGPLQLNFAMIRYQSPFLSFQVILFSKLHPEAYSSYPLSSRKPMDGHAHAHAEWISSKHLPLSLQAAYRVSPQTDFREGPREKPRRALCHVSLMALAVNGPPNYPTAHHESLFIRRPIVKMKSSRCVLLFFR